MKKTKIVLFGLVIAVSFMCCKKDNGPAFNNHPGTDSATTSHGKDTATHSNGKDTATHSNGKDTATMPIGTDTATVMMPFSNGDQIVITASKLDSGASSSLVFVAETKNSYVCTSNTLSFQFSSDAASYYNVDYTGVSKPSDCTTGTSQASSTVSFEQTAGTRALNITFNGKTYSGTITKTGDKFTINWNYTSGVTISPTNL
jgi:hypothetical protein